MKEYSDWIKITQRTWGHAKLHFREAGSKIQAMGNFTESKIEFLLQRSSGGRRMVGRQMERNLTDENILKENACVWAVYGS